MAIDPITGLEIVDQKGDPKKEKKIDPITGLPIEPTAEPTRRVEPYGTYLPQYNREDISRYKRYNVPTLPGIDWNEERARRQPKLEKWGNGAAKALVTTVGATAENTIGFFYGMGSALYNWDRTKLYDNPVGRAVDKYNKAMQESFPNYYTQEEREATGWGSIQYANFWADKFLNGLGYAAGSIGTIYATGGAGLMTRAAKAMAKKRMYRLSKAIAAGDDPAAAVEGLEKMYRTKMALNAGQQFEMGLMMAAGESSVEAREILHRTTDNMMKARAEELGVLPSQLSEEDKKEVREMAAAVANLGFAANMAVVGGTNFATFGKAFMPKYLDMNKPTVLRNISRDVKTGKVIDELAEMPAFKRSLVKYYQNPLKNGLNETFQEGSQWVIQEAADDVTQKKFGSNGITSDFFEAIAANAGRTFTEGEGQEAMMLGFLIGAMTGGATSVKEYRNRAETDKRRKEVVEALNDEGIKDVLSRATKASEIFESLELMQSALENGDHKAYRDNQFKVLMTTIDMHHEAGTLDLFKEQLDDVAQMEDEEFSKAFGIPMEALEGNPNVVKTSIIKSLKDRIDKYVETRRKTDIAFNTAKTQGLPRLFMSKDSKQREEDLLKSETQLRTMLLRNSLALEDSQDRMQSLIDEINKEAELEGEEALTLKDFKVIGDLFEVEERNEEEQTVRKVTPAPGFDEKTSEKLKQVRERISEKGGIEETETRRKVRDLELLAGDRFKAVNAIRELMSDPETRSSVLQAEAQRENEEIVKKVNKALEDKVEQSQTLQELKDLEEESKGGNITSETKAKYEAALRERTKDANKIWTESKEKTLTEIRQELEDLKNKREADQPYDALREETLQAALKEREKKGQEDAPADNKKKKKKKKKKEEDGEKGEDEEVGGRDAKPKADEPGSSGKEKPGRSKIANANGEFARYEGEEGDGKDMLVDENGDPVTGYDQVHKNVDLKAARARLAELAPEELEGTEGYLQVIENSDGEGHDVIGIYYQDELIGILNVKAYNKFRELIEPGEQLPIQFDGKVVSSNNVTNTRDKSGEKVFRPATEVSEAETVVGIGIVKGDNNIDSPVDSEEMDQAIAEIVSRNVDKKFGLNKGQVVLIVRNPAGEYVPLALSTKPLGKEGGDRFLDLLRQNNVQGIKDLAGITNQTSPDATFMINNVDGKVFINFQHKGEYVRIDAENFLDMMEGKEFDFDVVSIEKTEKDGRVNYKVVAKKGVNLDAIADGLKAVAEDLVYNKLKRQIDIDLLAESQNALETALERDLQADFMALENGHFYFDVGVKFTVDPTNANQAVSESAPETESEEKPESSIEGMDDGFANVETSLFSIEEEETEEGEDIEGVPEKVAALLADNSTTLYAYDPKKSAENQQVDPETGERLTEESDSFYWNSKTKKKYRRVTSIANPRTTVAPDNQAKFESAGIVGTKIDKVVRDFFENDGELDVSKYDVASAKVLEVLIEDLRALKAAFEKRGETVITKEVVVYNDTLGIAGTIDLITYDKKGKVRVYDVKSMRTNEFTTNAANTNTKRYEYVYPPKKGERSFSSRQKHQRQLSLYAILMNETHGIEVVGAGIIPIKVNYPDDGAVHSTTSSARLIKGDSFVPHTLLDTVDDISSPKKSDKKLFKLDRPATKTIDKEAAIAWLRVRFGDKAAVLVEQLEMVGNETVHGYVENGVAYLYTAGQAGTQYHEGFHLLFRTLLTEQQRQSLYEDALKEFGEPTEEDMAKARRGQEGISDADARLLALEERMADEFMYFMLNEEQMERTLPQKIAKFFKDLWAFIQAIFTGKMRMRQAFSLLENNRNPNEILGQMVRSPKAFAPGKVFMLNEMGYAPEVYGELMNLMSYMAVNTREQFPDLDETALLGSADGATRSSIRDWFLRHSFHVADGTQRGVLGDELFQDLIEAYDGIYNAVRTKQITPQEGAKQLAAWKKVNGVKHGVPQVMDNGNPMPSKAINNRAHRHFMQVYDAWFDVEDNFGGIKTSGFRTELAERLRNYGIRVQDVEVTDTESDFERIFSLARMKEDPAKKLTEKARRALSKIPLTDTRETLFGFTYYVPITDIIHQMQGAVADATTMTEMLEILEKQSSNIPYMQGVHQFLTELSAEEKGLFFSSMALSMSNFVTMVIEQDRSGNLVVKTLNPAALQVDYYIDFWENKSITKKGIYKLKDGKRTITELKLDKINKLWRELQSERKAPTKATYKKAADLLWAMGIELGPTRKEARRRVIDVFENSDASFNRTLFGDRRGGVDLEQIVKEFRKGKTEFLSIFKSQKNRLKKLTTTFVLPYESPKAASFNSATGEAVWPLNQKTDLTITRDMMRSGELAALFAPPGENTIGHSVNGVETLGVTLMKADPYTNTFQPVDLDGLRIKNNNKRDTVKENDTLTFDESLALRINMYKNISGNSDVMFIALDTQADRNRMTFIPIPKWDSANKLIASRFGLEELVLDQFDSPAESEQVAENILLNYIILDLHRIGTAIDEIAKGENLIEGYHTNKQYLYLQSGFGEDAKLPEDKVALAATVSGALEGGATVQEILERNPEVAELVGDIMKDFFERADRYTNEIVDMLGGTEAAGMWATQNVDHRAMSEYKEGEKHKIIADFVLADMIGGLVSREIFNGSRNYTKDGADYFKRSSLTTTPGIVLMMRGDVSDDYGMQPEFNEITIEDIMTNLPADQLLRLYDALVNKTGVSKDRALSILSPYGLTKDEEGNLIVNPEAQINTTDAQAFITIHLYRSIMMGMGQWSDEHEEAYRNYKGYWRGPALIPLKPSYEMRVRHEGKIVPISHKNSYIVLTDALVDEIPTMRMLLDRMELRQDGDGLKTNPNWDFTAKTHPNIKKIDVANTKSAKKKGTFIPVNSLDPQALLDAPVQTLDSRGLKFPQLLPDKTEKSQMTLGRQPRKNMIANIKLTEDYIVGGKKMSGAKLIELYHKAVVGKLKLNEDKVHKELGYDRVLAATNPTEKLKALKYMMPRFRDKMRELGFEKEYTQNLLNALELGSLDSTRIPLSFPSIQSKLEQLLNGMFRSNVYQQKVLGQEMVQFSEYGPSERDGSLKFYDIEDGSVAVAQIDVRTDVLRAMGINPGQSLAKINEQLKEVLGYRIPQQGKSSMIILQVREVLDEAYSSAAVRVPAGITAMMGSDFDVDKLFLMFPETEGRGRDTKKVEVPYDTIENMEDLSTLDEKVLNNLIFDVFRGVGSSVLHLDEALAGVEIADLQEARDDLRGGAQNLDLNSPLTRIQTGIDNMLSMALRGIYANAIAGRNVVQASGVQFTSEKNAEITITDSEFEAVGKVLNQLVTQSPFSNLYTDLYLSQYLSAAVDSVKDPLQGQINDNSVTAILTVYMLSMGMTPKQAIAILNVPAFRSIVDSVRSGAFRSLEKALEKQLIDFRAQLDPEDQKNFKFGAKMKFDIDALRAVSKGEQELTEEETILYIRQMYRMTKEARKLDNLYRVVTPDAIDKAGTIPQHLARLDVVDRLTDKDTRDEDQTFGGLGALQQITEGNAYPIVKAYIQATRRSVQVATTLGFMANQPAVVQFKAWLKENFRKAQLNEFYHRDINRAILHYVVTQPGSPLFESGLLDRNFIYDNHINGDLQTKLDDLLELINETGMTNVVLQSLRVQVAMPGDEIVEFLEVDPIIISDKMDKDNFTAGLLGMYMDPSRVAGRILSRLKAVREQQDKDDVYNFGDDETVPTQEELAADIKEFTRMLISNMIVSTGFAPGKTTMFDLLPVEVLEDLGVTDHLRNEMKRIEADPQYLDKIGFNDEFVHSYSHTSIKGEPIVREQDSITQTDENGEFAKQMNNIPRNSAYLRITIDGESRIYRRVTKSKRSNTYVLVVKKAAERGFYEGNIRDEETGKKLEGSMVFDNTSGTKNAPTSYRNPDSQESLLDIEDSVTPATAQATADKLRRTFAEAGLDVTVEFGDLPQGTKGQIEGNVITIDPSQVRGDTVYHEFAHIIVDMLPREVVAEYIQQVMKADPELANLVRAKYGNKIKDEFTLGKEILVTAIGREGAKLERKNPNKLQRLINRIIRAIAKFFGIKPNAAETLARKMFEGKVAELNLSGEFNPAIQRSLTLEDRVKNITDDLLITLRKRKESLRKADDTDARVLEIKTIERQIRKIREGEEELTSFISLAQYVQTTVRSMRDTLREVKEKSSNSLSKDEGFALLNTIAELKEQLDALYDRDVSRSTVAALQDLLEEMDIISEDNIGGEVLTDLDEALRDLRRIERDYSEEVLPLVADVLLSYADTEGGIDQAELDRIRKNKDLTGFRLPAKVFGIELTTIKYAPFRQLVRAYREGKINKEQFNEKALDLKIEFLKNKNIVHRDQLIKELQEAHADKSGFSFYLDPMTYSNEANFQLFALALKEGINKATEKTRGFLFELEEQYSKLKASKGSDWNINRLNGDLLQEVTVMRNGKPMKVLSLVQEFDVEKFYAAREAMHRRVDEKYGKPERFSDEFKEWLEATNEDGDKLSVLHRREIVQWYKENTEGIDRAEEKIADLEERIETLDNLKSDIEIDMMSGYTVGEADKVSQLETEIKYLRGKLINSATKKDKDGNRVYLGSLAKPKKELYRNPKWDKVQSTPELKEYYDFIVSKYHTAQSRVGRTQLIVNNWDDYSYIMPSFRKAGLDKIQDEGWRDAAKEITRDFRILDTDQQAGHQAFDVMEHEEGDNLMELNMERLTGLDGRPLKTIPKYGTNLVEASVVSRDIAGSIAQFEHMSNMFEEKSKMAGLVEGMLNAHERRRVLQTDGTGNPIIDKTSTLIYGVGKQMVDIDAEGSFTLEHLRQFIDSVYYGIADKGDNITGTFSGNKLASTATGITAAVNLSINFLQLGNQMILDTVMGGQEAWAGQFFGMEDFAWAQATYFANGAAMKDAGVFVNKTKLGQAITMFDSMVEVTDNIGRKLTGGKLKKFLQDPLFFTQHGIEHQTSTVRMLALMRSYKGKLKDKNGNVLKNDSGQDADVWDMLIMDEKGKLIIDPRVANFNRERFIAKLHGIHRRANQVKGSFDRAMAQRTIVGKLLLVFRNFIIPGWRKRFGHGEPYHMDYELGDMTRGMYMSTLSYIGNMFRNMSFVGLTEYNKMSLIDQQNIKRTMYDLAFYVMAMSLHAWAMGKIEDDDDESYATAFTAYQARRLQAELAQFLRPDEALRIVQSPMATTNLVAKAATFLNQLLINEPLYHLGLKDQDKIFYQRKTAYAAKGDRKIKTQFKKILPVINGLTTAPFMPGSAESVKEKLRWFEDI